MAGIRVVVTLTFPNEEVAGQALAGMVEAFKPKAQEEGALQYELFQSCTEPCKVILLEHWASKALYDKHWIGQVEREGLPDLSDPNSPKVAFEFYHHDNYTLVDGIWQPLEPEERLNTIRWV